MKSLNLIEDQTTAFMQVWGDNCLEVACGMANTQGGKLYVGVNGDGEVLGISKVQIKEYAKILPEKIIKLLNIYPLVNLLEIEGLIYLVIEIYPASIPVKYKGEVYIRSKTETNKLTDLSLEGFIDFKTSLANTWDRSTQIGASLDDLDIDSIEKFKDDAYKSGRLNLSRCASLEAFLAYLNLFSASGLTKAAIILFGKEPSSFYHHTYVSIFQCHNSQEETIAHKKIYGNLIQLQQRVIEKLIDKYLVKYVEFGPLIRTERLEYPKEALREIILNALIHRDYQIPERISIYKMNNSLSVHSPGSLTSNLAINELSGATQTNHRNPLIAKACNLAGYINKHAQVIAKIKHECMMDQLPEPEFTASELGFSFKLNQKFLAEQEKKAKLNDKAVVMKQIYLDDRITIEKLSYKTGLSESVVRKNVQYLIDHDYIFRDNLSNFPCWLINRN